MPNPRKSLTGKTFGLLEVIAYQGQTRPGGNSLWLCRCRCGTEKVIAYQHLTAKSRSTKSCGCHLGKWPKKPRKAP